MCDTCGCNDSGDGFIIAKPENGGHVHYDHLEGHDHVHHHHNHEHEHEHSHLPARGRLIEIEQDALHKNNLMAERNRGFFEARNILAINLVSSPGSGKTTILEKTIQNQKLASTLHVIEGDQQTSQDSNRIHATGVPVVQINTGNGCHLDAIMINAACRELNPALNAILMIENVGNLVCPAMFDLGEKFRVVIVSVTEGEDKPLKYPYMFQTSDLCIINKVDLLPHLDFNMEELKNNAKKTNPRLGFIELSARTGEGFDKWIDWLESRIA